MKRQGWGVGLLVCFLPFRIVALGETAELTSPPVGAVYEAGQSYLIRVEPGEGETLISMLVGFTEVKLASGSKILEYTVNLPKDVRLGSDPEIIGVAFLDRNGQYKEIELSHTITVVLPPTTTVTGIGASFNGDKKTFLEIARKPTRELVVTEGTNSTDTISVDADYSDGVARAFDNNPDLTYKSLDEKVATVIPQVGSRPLVKATGPGTTDIIVQYGELTDRVTVHVKECPYTEGMKRCPR